MKGGGRDALVGRFRSELETMRPDVVFALDPRHGTSCHPNHRAVSLLLQEAVLELPEAARPELWFENDFFIESRMDEEMLANFRNGAIYAWPDDQTPLHWYDAIRTLPNARDAWHYMVAAQRLHATQYPELADGTMTPSPPTALRRIPFVRAQDIDATVDLCTALELRYRTFDVHGIPSPEQAQGLPGRRKLVHNRDRD